MSLSKKEVEQHKLKVNKDSIEKIIRDGEVQELIEKAKELGDNLKKLDLKSNQIRNVFDPVRKIQAKWTDPDVEYDEKKHKALLREFILLKPKLAYQASRQLEVTPLKEWLTEAINMVAEGNPSASVEYRRFSNFVDFFEATLAYHASSEENPIKRNQRHE